MVSRTAPSIYFGCNQLYKGCMRYDSNSEEGHGYEDDCRGTNDAITRLPDYEDNAKVTDGVGNEQPDFDNDPCKAVPYIDELIAHNIQRYGSYAVVKLDDCEQVWIKPALRKLGIECNEKAS